MVCVLSINTANAQTTGPQLSDFPGDFKHGFASVDGKSVPLLGRPTVSVPTSTDQLMIGLTSEPGKRMRFRVEGIDEAWHEGPSNMVIGVRFFDAQRNQITQQDIQLAGQSAGWNGDLQKPMFVPRQEVFVAPPGAHSFWIVISSAGPPQTLGTLLIKGLIASRRSADGTTKTVLQAPVGRSSQATPSPAPMGFLTDGTKPKMATLRKLSTSTPDQPVECFSIIDDDVLAHAEWHTITEEAPAISAGEQLQLQWEEAYSIGMGGSVRPSYERPPSGSYTVRLQTLDLLGQPVGEECSMSIHVLAPWWQNAWILSFGLLGIIGVTVGATRYFAHLRTRDQLAQLTLVNLVEQERLRIARDIHDTLAQGFTGVIVQLEAAEDAQARGLKTESEAHIKRAGALARESLEEARRSVRSLRAQVLEENDLPAAVMLNFQKMTAGTKLSAVLTVSGTPRRLDCEVAQNLLLIVQEALTNVLRHASARHFSAHLTYLDEQVHLELRDDGKGFDPSANHEGLGLRGMRERVEVIRGHLSIKTAPNAGTTISITILGRNSAAV